MFFLQFLQLSELPISVYIDIKTLKILDIKENLGLYALSLDTDQVMESSYYNLLVTGCRIQLQPTISCHRYLTLFDCNLNRNGDGGELHGATSRAVQVLELLVSYPSQIQEIENLGKHCNNATFGSEESTSTSSSNQTRQLYERFFSLNSLGKSSH